MSDFKGIMKNGWHPKGKDGGKESWRGDFKGINQVAGWVGKGKKADIDAAREHTSRPLATLKDPSAFGPPPKNVNYHGGAALPNEITPHRGGLGAPLTQDQIQSANAAAYEAEREEAEENARPAPPPLPYRADRTGLSTNHLPPPPIHRDIQPSPDISSTQNTKSQARAPPPLPSRQNTLSSAAEPPPPAYSPTPKPVSNSILNSSSIDRLGKAGVSVPAFGIGNSNEPNPWKNERSQSSNSQGGNSVSELQSRFSKMKSLSSQNSSQGQSPTSTTQEQQNLPSWQQSQHALQTAQNLQKNPSQVTMADAQAAAQTANQTRTSVNNFRDRHADSIANAQAKAKAWDQRYKVTSKINKFLDEHTEEDKQQQQQQQQQNPQVAGQQHNSQQFQQPVAVSPQTQQDFTQPQSQGILSPPPRPVPSPRQSSEMQASISRKPPPPPPPKKPASMQAPPPVPMGTKPR